MKRRLSTFILNFSNVPISRSISFSMKVKKNQDFTEELF